jgi:hypothetical protein
MSHGFGLTLQVRRRNRLKAAAMAVLLAVGGAYALASLNWCPRRLDVPPKVISRLSASGPLEAGAAAVALKVPYPIVAAGYGPRRPELSSAAAPLKARALVLSEQAVSFGVVALDLLEVPDDLASEVRAKSGLNDAWVVATHSHASLGGYDRRLVAQLAGTGPFRADARAAVVGAAVEALGAAARQLQPVTVEVGQGTAELSAPRSGELSDGRIWRVRFGTVGQLLLLAAHPTLVPRPAPRLDPDYPGLLAEGADAGVTLVLQTAGGNARSLAESPSALAAKAAAAFDGLPLQALEAPALSVTRVQLRAPSADATRLVPRLFAMPGRNLLCGSAPSTAEVSVLKLGSLELAALPAEVSYASGQALGLPLVSLADGYLGYVEPAEVVDAATGESKRQYYERGLLAAFQAALQLAR